MTQVIQLAPIIAQKVKMLPPEQQQQVLDFVDFLLSKTQQLEFKHSDGSPMSALEAAGDVVGCVEGGLGDLAIEEGKKASFGVRIPDDDEYSMICPFSLEQILDPDFFGEKS